MKKTLFISALFYTSLFFAQGKLEGAISSKGIISNGDTNPFWMYSNQRGRLDQETTFNTLAQLKYSYAFNENSRLDFGGGLLYKNGLWDDVYIDELYGSYSYKQLALDIGIKQRPEQYMGLSSTNGDVLWSNNSMAMPGIRLGLNEPFLVFPFAATKFNIAHYEMNDDRFVEGTMVHYKSVYLDVRPTPKDIISWEMYHYVQWGGVSPTYGRYPEDFDNFQRLFLGRSSLGDTNSSDKANAYGNHLGAYELKYIRKRDHYDLTFYYLLPFEDRSGRYLNNFPDGVWGLFFDIHEGELLKGLSLEYVQTVSQSGRYAPLGQEGEGDLPGTFKGGDNYFIGNQYASGWTYRNQIIGLPFIFKQEDGHPFTNSRSYVLHVGATGHFWNLDYKAKLSYVENLGTYPGVANSTGPLDPHERALYSYFEFVYPTEYGQFTLELGQDFSNIRSDVGGASLGYTYTF